MDIINEKLEEDEGAREVRRIAEEAEYGYKNLTGPYALIVSIIAEAWSLFQLSLATVIMLDSVTIRAIHLTFAVVLVFLCYPMFKKPKKLKGLDYLAVRHRITILDFILAAIAGMLALYIVLDYTGLAQRQGALISRDIFIGVLLVLFVLEAARHSLGPVLPIVAIVFILYYLPATVPDDRVPRIACIHTVSGCS